MDIKVRHGRRLLERGVGQLGWSDFDRKEVLPHTLTRQDTASRRSAKISEQ
jgi:hypothetical protein